MSRGAALRGAECVAHFWAAAVNTLMGVLAISGHQADTALGYSLEIILERNE